MTEIFKGIPIKYVGGTNTAPEIIAKNLYFLKNFNTSTNKVEKLNHKTINQIGKYAKYADELKVCKFKKLKLLSNK